MGTRQTRGQDEERKIKLMQIFKKQGIMLASEDGVDFGVPYSAMPQNVDGKRVPAQGYVILD